MKNKYMLIMAGVAIVVALGAGLAVFIPYYVAKQEEKNKPEYGKISKIISLKVKRPCISIGGTEFIWGGAKHEPMFSIGNISSVYVWMKDEELRISITVKDNEGRILTYINDNEWVVIPGLIKDRNFDGTSLEVIGPEDEVILQVELKDECVTIGVVNYSNNGEKVMMADNMVQWSVKGRKFEHPLKRIFYYPSEGNIGRKVN